MKTLNVLVGMAGIAACHNAPGQFSHFEAPCFSPYEAAPAGAVRIDGPGAFGPHVNDSLIVQVDNRERWRGALQSCVREVPGLSFDLGPWQAADDTLEVTSLDRTSRSTYSTVWRLQLVTRRKKQR
jgi:hypothetical protein